MRINTQAQEAFQRIYQSNERFINGAVVQNSTGGYYVLNSIDSNTDTTTANIMSLDAKGDILWSKNYHFNGQESVVPQINLTLLEKDTFAFVVLQRNESLNTVLTKVNPDGTVLWSKAYGLPVVNNSFNGSSLDPCILLDRPNGGIALFTTILNPANNLSKPYVALVDHLGNIETAKLLEGRENVFELITDAKKTPDGGYILSGISFDPRIESFLIKFDSFGALQWSKSYEQLGEPRITGVEPTNSNSYIIIGETGSSDSFSDIGFIGHIDSIGAPKWVKRLDTSGYFTYKIVGLEDGNFQTTGFYEDSHSSFGNIGAWKIKFDINGTSLWQKAYDVPTAPFSYGFWPTNDGGSIQSARSPSTILEGNFGIHLIKTNAAGASSCEVDVAIDFILDSLETDTLGWTIEAQTASEERFPQITIYDGFITPISTLTPPMPFCEDTPVGVELDATIEEGTAYLWGDEAEGQTGPIITATSAGIYTVNIRIESMGCYNICDTVIISETGPPTASIEQIGNLCVDGSSFLLANTEGIVTDYAWSTGADTSLTAITEPGTYSISVSNDCGVGFADITLTDELEVSIQQTEDLCTDGIGTLGTLINGTAVEFNWSTGEEEDLIEITAEGNYSLTVSNFCSEATAEIEVDCIFDLITCIGVPNAFTPDNDRDNDTFNVIIAPECAFGVAVGKIEIWNRWGELVYESETGQDWDGTQNGQNAPSDVYLYKIEVGAKDQESTIFKGDLILVR